MGFQKALRLQHFLKLSVIRVSCFIRYHLLFASVSSACTLMFLVFESLLAYYFVECYVWSCVMFKERFTLCFKVFFRVC